MFYGKKKKGGFGQSALVLLQRIENEGACVDASPHRMSMRRFMAWAAVDWQRTTLASSRSGVGSSWTGRAPRCRVVAVRVRACVRVCVCVGVRRVRRGFLGSQ